MGGLGRGPEVAVSRALQSVARDVGLLLYLPATMAAVSLPVALATGDRHALVPLVVVGGVCAGLAWGLTRRYRHARTSQRWPAVEVVAIGWLLVGLAAAGVLWGTAVAAGAGADADAAFLDPWNALFEGLSGATSTGLTMVGGSEHELSRIVQWWRTWLQWVGAIGVVLFALGFAHPSSNVRTLYEAEGRGDEFAGDLGATVRRTWALYAGLTVVAVVALLLTDHSAWEALNHGITAISTGGFTITGTSFAGYGTGTKAVAAVLLVLGASSFVAHHVLLIERDVRRWSRLTPVRAQAAVLVTGGVLAVVLGVGSEVAIVDRIFQWVSASATAGFASVPNLGAWSTPIVVILVVRMAVGAPSGSTGGGAKLDRLTWLAKAAGAHLPSGSGQLHWDGHEVASRERRGAVQHATAMVTLWAITIAAGTAVVGALTDAALRDVLFEVTSAVSNVGLSTGVADAELSGTGKGVFSLLMYLGRVELLVALTFPGQREVAG
jgi:trk system potassium uptake protein TrkH